ncbi:MAG: hypothetical protein ACF8XB_20685 [Planctomycetota bacterium JB042]
MLESRKPARFGLATALAIGAVACSDAPTTPKSRGDDVRLLAPGDGEVPWTPGDWTAGSNRTASLEMRLALDLGYAGAPIPGQRLTTVTGLRVEALGPRRAKVELASLDVRPLDPDPEREAVIRADFDAQSPVGVVAEIDADGGTPRLRFEIPRGASGAVRAYLDHLRLALELLVVPWPADEVSRGARWTRSGDVDVARMRLSENTTFSLDELEADRAEIGVDGVFVLRDPELDLDGLPAGARCRLRSVDAAVSGRLETTADAPLPASGRLDLELRLTADVTHEGSTEPLDGRLDLRIVLGP